MLGGSNIRSNALLDEHKVQKSNNPLFDKERNSKHDIMMNGKQIPAYSFKKAPLSFLMMERKKQKIIPSPPIKASSGDSSLSLVPLEELVPRSSIEVNPLELQSVQMIKSIKPFMFKNKHLTFKTITEAEIINSICEVPMEKDLMETNPQIPQSQDHSLRSFKFRTTEQRSSSAISIDQTTLTCSLMRIKPLKKQIDPSSLPLSASVGRLANCRITTIENYQKKHSSYKLRANSAASKSIDDLVGRKPASTIEFGVAAKPKHYPDSFQELLINPRIQGRKFTGEDFKQIKAFNHRSEKRLKSVLKKKVGFQSSSAYSSPYFMIENHQEDQTKPNLSFTKDGQHNPAVKVEEVKVNKISPNSNLSTANSYLHRHVLTDNNRLSNEARIQKEELQAKVQPVSKDKQKNREIVIIEEMENAKTDEERSLIGTKPAVIAGKPANKPPVSKPNGTFDFSFLAKSSLKSALRVEVSWRYKTANQAASLQNLSVVERPVGIRRSSPRSVTFSPNRVVIMYQDDGV
jgi:hypothetical protein